MKLKINADKKINTDSMPVVRSEEVMVEVSNWYVDRYSKVLVQRNLLFMLLLFALIVVIYSVYQVSNVSSLYTLKPFVVQINPKTGITDIVNPYKDSQLTSDQALNQYFVLKYVKARESYCSTSYKYDYLTVVRLFSDRDIYANFLKFINSDPLSPIIVYANESCISVKIRSVQFLNDDQVLSPTDDSGLIKKFALVRFSIIDDKTNTVKSYKISSVGFTYQQMQLNMDDREINPLGFQVVDYKSDNEIINNQ